MTSSPFSNDHPVQLHVETGSSLAEVFLIDHAFALVDRAIGRLDASVEQGVYKVKAQLGDATTERLLVLNGDQTVDLSDELSVASPAPLKGTSKTHELHMDAAVADSSKVAASPGSGAWIFLCTRRWTSRNPDAADAPAPAAPPPLSLRRPDGTVIVDLEEDDREESAKHDPIAGTTVEVDPGSYVLGWSDDSGLTAEQTVQAVREWHTQVFLLEDGEAGGPDGSVRQEISVLMGRDPFSANDPTLRVAEEARAALAQERMVASEFINESLFGKFDNPMLGLFGAHLMLLGRTAAREAEKEESRRRSDVKRIRAPVSFDQSLFDHVVANLRELLGADHPDVIALATKSSDHSLDALEPVAVPPMLWRSWVLLIEASNERPELVPVATWRRTAKLLPLRPFLAWSSDESSASVEAWQRSVAPLVQGAAPPPPEGARAVAADMQTAAPADDPRRHLSLQLLAPRGVIDELATDAPAADAPA
jgi:hypothetical protein